MLCFSAIGLQTMRTRILHLLLTAALVGICLPASAASRQRNHRAEEHKAAAAHKAQRRQQSRSVRKAEAANRREADHARGHEKPHKGKPARGRHSAKLVDAPGRGRSEDVSALAPGRGRVRRGRGRNLSAPAVQAAAADESTQEASNAQDAAVSIAASEAADDRIRHNSKIHFGVSPARTPENAGDAALATTQSPATPSAAFVASATRQVESPTASAPALAAGVADEVADQMRVQPVATDAGAQPSDTARRASAPATAYVSSRGMPAGKLLKRTSTRPHIPSVEEEVVTPAVLPAVQPMLYSRRGHLVVPPAMKGSHEILVHQNAMADSEGLVRIQDDSDLLRLRSGRLLVALPQSAMLEVDERLPGNRRYCRPWTAVFLATLARAHYARFHTPLQVNSAVRTVAFQERLQRTNGNAAPAEGLTASPHLTGQAVDLAKHGLSMTEIAWLRGYLLPLVQEGKIDVEEEFQQSCFHISVYKRYLPQPAPRRLIADRTHHGSRVLASAIR